MQFPREGPPAISPRARRAARQLLVPVQALPIPAPGRRITERDVKAAAALFDSISMTSDARRMAWQKGLDAGTLLRIANGRPLDVADVEKLPTVPLRLPAERVKMTADERARIERLSAAVAGVPVVTLGLFVLASEIRKASRDGDPLPYLITALGTLLSDEEFRSFRAVVDGHDWIYRGQINVAVSRGPDEDEVTVVHNAERLTAAEIAALLHKGKVKLPECTGAMITVYPLAETGVDFETVRPREGQAAALSLSPSQLRPLTKGKNSTSISIQFGWEIGLTVDERLVSKKGARIFLLRLKSLLENASHLL